MSLFKRFDIIMFLSESYCSNSPVGYTGEFKVHVDICSIQQTYSIKMSILFYSESILKVLSAMNIKIQVFAISFCKAVKA